MAKVVYARTTLENLERAFAFLVAKGPEVAEAATDAIRTAIDTLTVHPLIGHPVRGELRELVVSFGRTGCVALYRFLPARDQVRILAMCHQRELDYPC